MRYWLRINSKKNINALLSTDVFKYKYFWNYEISEVSSQSPIMEIVSFLKKNQTSLFENNIKSENMSVWINYEYEKDCRFSLSHEELKSLGDLGIPLCFSCWEKGTTLDLSYDNSNLDEEITEYILKIKTDKNPNDFFSKKNFHFDNGLWCYQTDNVIFGIHELVSFLKKNQKHIFSNGITPKDINICFYYEYLSECSWEFISKEMKELGDIKIDLNIVCMKKDRN